MADDSDSRADADGRGTTAEPETQAAYFARRYGLAADALTDRAKLEAAARRLID